MMTISDEVPKKTSLDKK